MTWPVPAGNSSSFFLQGSTRKLRLEGFVAKQRKFLVGNVTLPLFFFFVLKREHILIFAFANLFTSIHFLLISPKAKWTAVESEREWLSLYRSSFFETRGRWWDALAGGIPVPISPARGCTQLSNVYWRAHHLYYVTHTEGTTTILIGGCFLLTTAQCLNSMLLLKSTLHNLKASVNGCLVIEKVPYHVATFCVTLPCSNVLRYLTL